MPVRNFDEVKPEEIAPGLTERTLISPEIGSERVTVRLLVIEPGRKMEVYEPNEERVYFFLSGRGVYRHEHADAYGWTGLIEPETAAWVSPGHKHDISNTGEGPMRTLIVSMKVEEEEDRGSSIIRLGETPIEKGLAATSRPLFNKKVVDAVKVRVVEYDMYTPGKSTPLHRHEGWEEIYYVTRGEGDMTIGDDVLKVRPGSAVYIPANVRHNMKVTGSDILEIFVVTSEV